MFTHTTFGIITSLTQIPSLWFPPPSLLSNPTPNDALGFKWQAAIEDDLRYLALTPSPAMEADKRQEVSDLMRIIT